MRPSAPVALPDVSAAVLKLSGAIFSVDDAYSFLSSPHAAKSNAMRLICWYISLGLISAQQSRWASSLFQYHRQYLDLVSQLRDSADPVSSLPSERDARLISSDVSRGMQWFQRHAVDLGLSPFHTRDAELRVGRILRLLSLTYGINYTQSYDRYAFITYLLTLDFCGQTSLPARFGEALCFFITHRLLKSANVSHILRNSRSVEEHFRGLDGILMARVPEFMGQLKAEGQGSIHFALRWQLLLFADEHAIRPLLLIWDHFLIHLDNFNGYLDAMCLAHLTQIPLPAPDQIPIEALQRFRDWDALAIIAHAEELMAEQSSQIGCGCWAAFWRGCTSCCFNRPE
jgi:hypothetical protein